MISKETAISMVQVYLDAENQVPAFGWVKYYHNPIKQFLANLLYPKHDFVSNYTFFLDRWIKPDENKWEELPYNKNMELTIDVDNVLDLDVAWWIPYDARAVIVDHNDRYRLLGISPIIVDKDSPNMYSTGSADPQSFIHDFKLYKQRKETKYKWQSQVINRQSFG